MSEKPLWERTSFWSAIGAVVSIVVSVTKGDLRWLLWIALAFGLFAILQIAKHIDRKNIFELFVFFSIPFGWSLYELNHALVPGDLAKFHILAVDVGKNRLDHQQLIANIYIQNDAGDADIIVYAMGGIAPVENDQREIIRGLRQKVSEDVRGGQGLHFMARGKEKVWFTIPSPTMSEDHFHQYNEGRLAFYFVSSLIIAEGKVRRELQHCAFVVGNNPRVILNCPTSSQ